MRKRAFKKLYNEFVKVPENEKIPDKVFNFRMVFSMLTCLACGAIAVSFAFAFYSDEVVTQQPSTITGAYYDIAVTDSTNNPVAYNSSENKYVYSTNAEGVPVPQDSKYVFTIDPTGTATTGFCKVEVVEPNPTTLDETKSYYTPMIVNSDSNTYQLTVQAEHGATIMFTPMWGTSSASVTGGEIQNNLITHSTTQSTSYTTENFAYLSKIAEHYGISEADIRSFNGLPEATFSLKDEVPLGAGLEIKIPLISKTALDAEPYHVPYVEYTVEPTATIENIISHYSTTLDEILVFTGLDSLDQITVGTTLKVPNRDPATTTPFAVPFTAYTVEPTLKLSDVVNHYNLTYNLGITEEDITVFTAMKNAALSAPATNVEDLTDASLIETVDTSETAETTEPSDEFTIGEDDQQGETATNETLETTPVITSDLTFGSVIYIPGVYEEVATYRVPFTTYVVEPAAKIENLASYYGVTVADILNYNMITELTVGSVVNVPGVVTDNAPYAVPYTTYTVEPTATLENIALFYQVPEVDIVAFNGTFSLDSGTVIKIPNVLPDATKYCVPHTVYIAEPTAELSDIVAYYATKSINITVDDILTYNGWLTAPELIVGTEVKIPGVAEETSSYSVSHVEYYVQPTATLSDISAYYKVSAKDIFLYNGGSIDVFALSVAVDPFAGMLTENNYLAYTDVLFDVNGDLIDKTYVTLLTNATLKIPGVDDISVASYSVPYVNYIVAENATLEEMATHYGILASDILTYNGIIELPPVGSVIMIPGVTSEYLVYVPTPITSADDTLADNVVNPEGTPSSGSDDTQQGTTSTESTTESGTQQGTTSADDQTSTESAPEGEAQQGTETPEGQPEGTTEQTSESTETPAV